MNFSQFRTQFQDYPVILSKHMSGSAEDLQALRNQLTRWEKKGWLIGLRRGAYLLNKNDRKIDTDINVIANVLYEPSYLSLEYALNFYGIIPEYVADVTSVTTRKTMRFSNELGAFVYQKIKPLAFRGFKRMGEGKNSFFMAEPEKAAADFLYLNLARFGADVRDVLQNSYRFQNIEELNPRRLIELGKLFENKKLMRVIREFAGWIEEEKS